MKKNNFSMISPSWTKPKIGPILRFENDFRFYTNIFNKNIYTFGTKKFYLLLTSTLIDENNIVLRKGLLPLHNVYIFSGLGNYLKGLSDYKFFLGSEIRNIISPYVSKQLVHQEALIKNCVAVHIRRGDMNISNIGSPLNNCHALPDEWFINTIQSTRLKFGENLKFIVFSDGSDNDLKNILKIENVTRAPKENTSLTDLLLMSKSKILITSSTSTMSAWSYFLGEGLSIWYPGWEDMYVDKSDRQIITDEFGLFK